MPTVTYVGKQIERAKVVELAVGSSTVGHTFITLVGGVKAVTYTAVAGDTTTTVTAAILALLQAEDAGEFGALTFAAHATDVTKIVVTGPVDGYPFVIATTGSTGTYTATTITAPLSPSDVADVLNYSGGALPAAADTLVIENTEVSLLYNPTALVNAITFIRRATHTGRIGLPDFNEGGYPEYLGLFLEVNSIAITIETNDTDQAAQIRITSTSGAAETVVIQGEGLAALGEEPVQVASLISTATVTCTDSGVAISPLAGQTSTIATVHGESSAVRVEPGCTVANHNYTTCDALIRATWTTALKAVKASTVTVTDSAASGAGQIDVFDSTLFWKSKGNCTGSGFVLSGTGTFDATDAPAAISGNTLTMTRGSSFLDPRFKVAFTSIVLQSCGLPDVTIDQGLGRTYTPA